MNQSNCTIPTLHQGKVTSPATLLPKSDISTKPWSKEAGEHCSGLLEVRNCTLSVGISKCFMSCQKNKKQTNKTHKHTQNKELT